VAASSAVTSFAHRLPWSSVASAARKVFEEMGGPVYLSLNYLPFCPQIMVDSGDEFFFKNVVDKSSKFPCYVT
jgi:hypothetical protein